MKYTVRTASTVDDMRAAQRLRATAFQLPVDLDQDRFDADCEHILIETAKTADLVGCFRIAPFHGPAIASSYSAQFYDLSALSHYPEKMVELGRFCTDPARFDPDILRAAWAALTRYVDEQGIGLLFGCTSFSGMRAELYEDAFAELKASFAAPNVWAPGIKAPRVARFPNRQNGPGQKKSALQSMPPLLRSYLMMGGWVSDHAVIDPEMNTLHVFTAVEVSAIPERRKQQLRRLL